MPRIIASLALVAVVAAGLSAAQVPEATCGTWALPSLPDWFTSWLRANRVGSTHQVACYVNPFYLRGDFDGTGPLDLAVLVVEKATGKRGALVIHRPSMTAHLLGAGTPIGNGGDDFTWLGYWRVERPPRMPNVFKDPVPRFIGEVLYVVKPEAASGWIGWNGRAYVWYQGAD